MLVSRTSRTTTDHVQDHIKIVLLLCFNMVMMDMNRIFIFFLLIQTTAGCNYHSSTGAYVQSQTVTLIAVLFWRPISSYLTDYYPKQNHLLLLITSILECLGLLAMLLLVAFNNSTISPWSILLLACVKQCIEVQLLNSTYKIFKMRLQLICGLNNCESQCHVISAVGIFSEFAELIFNILTCVTAYLFISHGASFEAVKYIYFGTTLIASMCCVTLSISIYNQASNYYIGDDTNVTLSALQSVTVTATAPLLDVASASSLSPSSLTLKDRVKGVCRVTVAVGSIILITLLYMAQELLYSVESLAIPGRNVNQSITPVPNNFCSGYVTNTIYQDIWENCFYMLGTLIYILVLKRMNPFTFFRYLFPATMIVLMGLSVVVTNLSGMSQLILALALQSTVAFEYFLLLFVKYLSIASVASEYYGVLSFITGSLQSLVDLSIYGCMSYGVATSFLNGVMYVFMILTVLFALMFSVGYKKELLITNQHCDGTRNT